MYRSKMNHSSTSNINSALDCAEARTVLTINTKQVQQQRQQKVYNRSSLVHSAPSTDASHLGNANFTIRNINNCNATCQRLPAMKAATATTTATAAVTLIVATFKTMQSARLSGQTRSPKRVALKKFVAFLPIICFAILAFISTASARTLHGRKLILHTLENRMLHHKNLLRYERELAPVPAHHHHLNTRSLDMNCAKVVKNIAMLRDQAHKSFNVLNKNVKDHFTKPRFNLTPELALEEWSKYKLNLSHPYTKLMDREFTKEEVKHDLSHLENGIKMNEQLIHTELNKIYRTIRMLQIIHNRTYNALNKKWHDDDYKNVIAYLNHTGNQLNTNLQTTNSVIEALNVTLENLDENSISYNETVQVLDWLVVAESISFFHYLDKLYEKLMEICSAPRYIHEGNM